jgi:hypothetical protein
LGWEPGGKEEEEESDKVELPVSRTTSLSPSLSAEKKNITLVTQIANCYGKTLIGPDHPHSPVELLGKQKAF